MGAQCYDGGCDRLAISPDGKMLYVPSFEGPHWNVVDAATGDVRATIVTNSGAHNTVYGPDGRRVYLAGLKSPLLDVADPPTHKVVRTVGPFSNVVRPFTVNGAQTLCFVNVNDLLGFEVGDLKTGKMLHRVEVAGFKKGPVKRHGCPSHGIGLTPDEKELWLADGATARMHVFDATHDAAQAGGQHQAPRPARLDHVQPRRQVRLPLHRRGDRHQTRKIVATLTDEKGRDGPEREGRRDRSSPAAKSCVRGISSASAGGIASGMSRNGRVLRLTHESASDGATKQRSTT